jgi:pimeloyl-ACP methyl ester carboxylesterase
MGLPPVMLVHGWGGSFQQTWAATPLVPLLEDAGRTVIGVDLLGHGTAPKPHDPAAYADMTERIVEALPVGPIDAVGFSLGAMTLLRTALKHPTAFRRLVLAGIGENVFRQDDDRAKRVVAAVRGEGAEDDVMANLFVQYANSPGNDTKALAAVMEREHPPLVPDQLASITCPVLIILGDKDFAGPGEPLADALAMSKLVMLRNTDHFATPEKFSFIDAVLDFLAVDDS